MHDFTYENNGLISANPLLILFVLFHVATTLRSSWNNLIPSVPQKARDPGHVCLHNGPSPRWVSPQKARTPPKENAEWNAHDWHLLPNCMLGGLYSRGWKCDCEEIEIQWIFQSCFGPKILCHWNFYLQRTEMRKRIEGIDTRERQLYQERDRMINQTAAVQKQNC